MEHNSAHDVEAGSVWKDIALSHFKWSAFRRLKHEYFIINFMMIYELKEQLYQLKSKSDHSIKIKVLSL